MAFGLYVHVPYCLQLCPYCDFTKYQWGKTLAPDRYTELVKKEIRDRAPAFKSLTDVTSIYFGGGTPSLLEPSLILSLLEEFARSGFKIRGPEISPEVTIEIDPATVDEARLDSYLEMGITRFSVGAQTFNDRLLKIAGRKHSSKDTTELLSMLKKRGVNYSFDLLFALPTQTLAELKDDLSRALDFGPSHLSAYCLTVPEGHKLDGGRAPEGEQIEMFDVIENDLAGGGLKRYEISNFAKPGFESRHNGLYWSDQPYWGIGLSSHSYLPVSALSKSDAQKAPYGVRFWNRRAMKDYEKEIETPQTGDWSAVTSVANGQQEVLLEHQAMTDYLHTSLRPVKGLSENALRLKFATASFEKAKQRLTELEKDGLVAKTEAGWALSNQGRLLANRVFEKLTFLMDELV